MSLATLIPRPGRPPGRLPGGLTGAHVQAVRAAVMAWAGPEGGRLRDLPWRRTRDPWAVLVSEVMLQQTQVARVEPKWRAFLVAYPDPVVLSSAPLGDVLRHWQGLGYPRRAKALRDLAATVTEHHGGLIPSALDELLALPGVGPYTARAVLAFAFEADGVGVLDTNSARVLARAVVGRPLGAREAQSLADVLVAAGNGWTWNQAMLDVGALHCTKRSPACSGCPLASVCRWRSTGGDDPAVGSAGVSVRQGPFEGSDRQARGRLLAALGAAAANGVESVTAEAAMAAMGVADVRAGRVIAGLVEDGLVAVDPGTGSVSLPSS